jgi:hypothetical protein
MDKGIESLYAHPMGVQQNDNNQGSDDESRITSNSCYHSRSDENGIPKSHGKCKRT